MSQQRAAAPEPSEIAGRYQVVQKLGAGAFGTVYKAKDKILGRMVAIKTIRLEGLAAASTDLRELTDRFKREAQVSAQLKHPNIVTIYDIGEADGTSYLAMEFIDGVGLDKIISGGPLPPERAALIAAQVADALNFAHRASVVHRDIKPANIMIESGDRVKVTDFGIAKVTNSGEHLTMTGSLLGTPSYMSPEQARGGNIDGRSDLFAVGCVLYEMLAGQKAFRGDSITGLIFKIITEEPPPLRELSLDLPDELVGIVAKALAKAPETRYQTGRELAEDLLALTRVGTTPTLRHSETPTAAGRPAPAAPTPPTVMETARSGPATVASPRPAPAPEQRPPATPSRPPAAAARPALPRPPAPPRKHSSAGLLVGLGVAGLVALLAGGAAVWFMLRSRAASPDAAGPELADLSTETSPPQADPTPLATESTRPLQPVGEPRAEPAAAPEVTPPPAAAPKRSNTLPATQGEARAPTPSAATAAQPTPADEGPPAPAAAPDPGFLDREPPPVDGAEAGKRLAEAYRSQSGRSSGAFGTSSRHRQRERSPRDLTPAELPAVATLRHVMNAQEAFYRKQGRYATLAELKAAGLLFLDVPFQARQFLRRNYRFDLEVLGDGFRVTAAPNAGGLRPFVGDDTGFIREGSD